MWAWAIATAGSMGCQTGTIDLREPADSAEPTATSPTDPGPPPPVPAVEVEAPVAFDPIRGGPLSITAVADEDAEQVQIVVADVEGTVLVTSEAGVHDAFLGWNGRLEGDAWAPAGRYLYQAIRRGPGGELVEQGEIHLVRCGIEAVYVEGDGGLTATRVPLYWHGPGLLQDVALPVVAVEAIETEEGYAVDLPEVSDDLDAPVSGSGEPFAVTWDSRPIVSLVVGDSAAFAGTGLDGVDVSVEVDGWTVAGGVPLVPGQAVVLQADAPVADTLGVFDLALELRFVDPDGTAIASQTVPLRAFALLGEPTFDRKGDRYAPWVAAVEPALRALEGVAPEHGAVTSELVRWIFEDLGLEYDTRWGASVYASYPGGWESGVFNMTSFLTRQFGTVVNCSDCAGILTTYANMLGASLAYVIVLPSFDLNYILAIGGDEFTSCPFGGGGCGFSYHAVTTHDGAETIWDATLAIDGDGDPGSLPATTQLVQGIGGDAYLDAIVRAGNPGYVAETKGEIE